MSTAIEPSPAPDAYLTETEVARRTTLSPRKLQHYRRDGGGPAFSKLGKRVVYLWSDVAAWIASNASTGRGPQ